MPAAPSEPRPSPLSYVEHAIATFPTEEPALSVRDLGRLRVDLLHRLSRLPDNTDEVQLELREGVAQAALLAWQTVGTLALTPPATLLWNEELDPPATFIGRTILLADHVLTPDRILAAASHRTTNAALRHLARTELRREGLIRTGRVISVPSGPALATGGDAAYEAARLDLTNAELTDFIRDQLVIEGPTAREALFVNAKDDFEHEHTCGSTRTSCPAASTRTATSRHGCSDTSTLSTTTNRGSHRPSTTPFAPTCSAPLIGSSLPTSSEPST